MMLAKRRRGESCGECEASQNPSVTSSQARKKRASASSQEEEASKQEASNKLATSGQEMTREREQRKESI